MQASVQKKAMESRQAPRAIIVQSIQDMDEDSRPFILDIFSYNIVLVPIHLPGHWSLIAIHVDKKAIVYYDSLKSGRMEILYTIWQFLVDDNANKQKLELGDDAWTYHRGGSGGEHGGGGSGGAQAGGKHGGGGGGNGGAQRGGPQGGGGGGGGGIGGGGGGGRHGNGVHWNMVGGGGGGGAHIGGGAGAEKNIWGGGGAQKGGEGVVHTMELVEGMEAEEGVEADSALDS
uniref:Ubiquitin-like protease family profile domain-containing protein n=1 Tax=Ditylenchus dipsaci TaxID=166011 RepID=A0A915D3I0_9BILA